jgi:hypothetical protein
MFALDGLGTPADDPAAAVTNEENDAQAKG